MRQLFRKERMWRRHELKSAYDVVIVGVNHNHTRRSLLLDPLVEVFITLNRLESHQSVFTLHVDMLLGFAGILEQHEKLRSERRANLLK